MGDITIWAEEKMDEFSERIYEIDDGIRTIEDNESAIIEYLYGVQCSLTLGLELRRYFCRKYGKRQADGTWLLMLNDKHHLAVSDYLRENYDITKDDLKEYTEIFYSYYLKYNKLEIPKFTKAEARRLLQLDTTCQRKKMFEISFALHLDHEDMHKFLTDMLAEQTYNMRDPKEIIALFCHSHEEHNSYDEYSRLCEKYVELSKKIDVSNQEKRENYTEYARETVYNRLDTENDLFDFLTANQSNYVGYSETAYREFKLLYDKACELADIQSLSNDDYIYGARFENEQQHKAYLERVNRSIELHAITNTEQLARRMLECIPRATFTKEKNGKKIVSTDFISISNAKSSSNGKKMQTTMLPKDITSNLLIRDRLDDLLFKEKAVERKDLVFIFYFVFSLELQKKDAYTMADYLVFCDECDAMLLRCGMSRLYFANRFENLVLLSLRSSNPFEMFENIIEYSFFNEPEATEE